METKQYNSNEYFRSLFIMYIALIMGQVFFVLIAIFINQFAPINIDDKNLENIYLLISVLFTLAGFYGSSFLFKQRMALLKKGLKLFNKLEDYRSACLVRWALLEGPSFMAIIGYFLTGNLLFLIIPLIIIGYFILIKPSVEMISTDLALDDQEKMRLKDSDSIISENDK